MHLNTHTHTTILQLSGLCSPQPEWPAPQETFTHSHLWWSSVILYLLPPSITVQGIRTFLHPIIVFFSQHIPILLQPLLL